MFKITLGDVWRGIVMAITAPVAVAILGVLGAVITSPNFDVFLVDWATLGRNLINTCIVASYGATSGYILKNLLTNDKGDVLGIPTKT